MRRKHPRVILLHWSRRAYQVIGDPHAWLDRDEDDPDEDEPTATSIPLYPIIKLVGAQRWKQLEFFQPKRNHAPPPELDFIEVTGPVSDDVVPIIFGDLHKAVYVRLDVAKHLRPYMAPSQRLTPVHCDGDTLPYLALTETAPEVWLPENWCYIPCAERSAPEFHGSGTLISPIFPDAFDAQRGVHFVGHYGGLFLDMVLWLSLRKAIPSVADWLDTKRIVVDDGYANAPVT
jgi:hypothetical protein